MMATWMIYCALCAVWLTLAAILVERVLLEGRGPVRAVWVTAIGLSLMLPAVFYWRAPAPQSPERTQQRFTSAQLSVVSGTGRLDRGVRPSPSGSAAIVDATSATSASAVVPTPRWETMLAVADRPLVIVWIVSSALLALYVAGGMAVLARLRRSWRPVELFSHSVLISDHTGPALVGLFSPAIVIPEWALSMDPRHLGLTLQHEDEHRRARDGQLLTIAQLALVAMPWNPAVWWQIARLRAAVELDCDARVLREADVRSYGDLLLQAARPGRGRHAVGITALAEHATQLERRIRLFIRPLDPRSRAARRGAMYASAIGAAGIACACMVPRPSTAVGLRSLPVEVGKAAASPAPLLASLETGQAPRTDTTAPARRATSVPMRAIVDDTIYLENQVEHPATLAEGSTLPPPPPAVLGNAHIVVSLVVDTLGNVDTTTIRIDRISQSLPLFGAMCDSAVRAHVPSMRFVPAETGGHKVKQLVRMPLTFTYGSHFLGTVTTRAARPALDPCTLRTPAELAVLSKSPGMPIGDNGVERVEMELDRQVAVAPANVAASYPAILQCNGRQGSVFARFTVDTSGHADMSTFHVAVSTHDLFSEAVRDHLPEMTFIPAERGGRLVAQSVQMNFTFRLTP